MTVEEAAVKFVEDISFDQWQLNPIEKMMYLGLLSYFRFNDFGTKIFPQFETGPIRVDFALFSDYGIKIVVECDGHDFHEKTREQVARDKKRDRFLSHQGFMVLRFSGREINEDPFSCGEDVYETIRLEAIRRYDNLNK